MQKNIIRLDLSSFSHSTVEAISGSPLKPRIAVLPFVEQDEESRQRRRGRWLADDVLHHLARFRFLSVVGRRASDVACSGHDSLEAVGRTLDTRYLATGAIHAAEGRLTVSVRLVDSRSGLQLWCAPYQISSGGLIDPEDDLAKEVATGLALSIDASERARLGRGDQADGTPEATTPLILNADRLTKQFQHHTNQQARRLAEKALLIDPMSAGAHAVLSRTHHLDGRYGWTADRETSIEQAIELAELALQLDPMETSGYAEIGMNRHYLREYESAQAAYMRALDINPNDPDILADFCDLLISIDEPEQAIEPLSMAIHLRPERAGMYRYYLAGAFDQLGDDEMVVSLLSEIGDVQEGHRMMAASHARLGMTDKAAHYADLALKAHPAFSLAHWQTILPHRNPDIRARIIDGLARAGLH